MFSLKKKTIVKPIFSHTFSRNNVKTDFKKRKIFSPTNDSHTFPHPPKKRAGDFIFSQNKHTLAQFSRAAVEIYHIEGYKPLRSRKIYDKRLYTTTDNRTHARTYKYVWNFPRTEGDSPSAHLSVAGARATASRGPHKKAIDITTRSSSRIRAPTRGLSNV